MRKIVPEPPMRTALLSTGDRLLAEASPHYDVWGIGLRANDSAASNPAAWRGQNLLGSILERVRTMMPEDLIPLPAPPFANRRRHHRPLRTD